MRKPLPMAEGVLVGVEAAPTEAVLLSLIDRDWLPEGDASGAGGWRPPPEATLDAVVVTVGELLGRFSMCVGDAEVDRVEETEEEADGVRVAVGVGEVVSVRDVVADVDALAVLVGVTDGVAVPVNEPVAEGVPVGVRVEDPVPAPVGRAVWVPVGDCLPLGESVADAELPTVRESLMELEAGDSTEGEADPVAVREGVTVDELVGVGVSSGVVVEVGDFVGVGLPDGVDVLVPVLDTVPDEDGVMEGEGTVAVALSDARNDIVGEVEPVAVGLDDAVAVPDRVPVGLLVDVGVADSVEEAVAVSVAVDVEVVVRLGVGVPVLVGVTVEGGVANIETVELGVGEPEEEPEGDTEVDLEDVPLVVAVFVRLAEGVTVFVALPELEAVAVPEPVIDELLVGEAVPDTLPELDGVLEIVGRAVGVLDTVAKAVRVAVGEGVELFVLLTDVVVEGVDVSVCEGVAVVVFDGVSDGV